MEKWENSISKASFWTNLGLLQPKNISDCNQPVFFIKKVLSFLYIKTIREHFESKLTSDRSNSLRKQLQIIVSSFLLESLVVLTAK